MKRFLFLILIAISLVPFHARATHVMGAEMSYKYLSPNTYQITLVLYGNCGTDANEVNTYLGNITNLDAGKPQIHVFDSTISKYPQSSSSNMRYANLLAGPDTPINISPYCQLLADSNSCDMPTVFKYPGVKRFVFTGTLVLPYASTGWVIEYTSLNPSCNNPTGRTKCSNFKSDGHDNINAVNVINNTNNIANSSPVFSTKTYNSVYSLGVPSTFVESGVDPDGDSLYYYTDLIYQASDANCFNLLIEPFMPGYSVNNPLAAAIAPGSYNFNNTNGNMAFTPSLQGRYAVSTTVMEFRHGVYVGSTLRQLTLFFFALGGGPLVAGVDTASIKGATVTGTDTLYTCPGSVVSFNIAPKDLTSDSIKVTFDDIIGGSSVSVNNNNTPSPTVSFSWNTQGVPYGVYTITPHFTINSCPLPSVSSHTYTIIIGDAGDLTYNVLSATDCIYKAAMQYNVNNGGRPYTLKLLKGTDTLKTYTEPANTPAVQDSLAPGNYFVILQTTGLPCTSYIPMDIFDSGPFPYKPRRGDSLAVYCRNFKDSTLAAYLDSGANYLKWYDESNNPIPGPVLPSTATAGTFVYTVSQVYKTCESARDTLTVIVNPDVCDYDVDIHNVITPNGDGKNDLWEIDNLKFYPDVKVELFDKLGDKVYEQSHYGSPWWDGGKVPSGVYYYIVDLGKPNIATGQQKYTGTLLIKR